MVKMKVAVTIDEKILHHVDALVAGRSSPSRSHLIEEAVREKLDRMNRSRLARECAKLDPGAERAMAEEGLSRELQGWPEY